MSREKAISEGIEMVRNDANATKPDRHTEAVESYVAQEITDMEKNLAMNTILP